MSFAIHRETARLSAIGQHMVLVLVMIMVILKGFDKTLATLGYNTLTLMTDHVLTIRFVVLSWVINWFQQL